MDAVSQANLFAGIFVDQWIELDHSSSDPLYDKRLCSNARPTAAEWLSATLTNRENRARTSMIKALSSPPSPLSRLASRIASCKTNTV